MQQHWKIDSQFQQWRMQQVQAREGQRISWKGKKIVIQERQFCLCGTRNLIRTVM